MISSTVLVGHSDLRCSDLRFSDLRYSDLRYSYSNMLQMCQVCTTLKVLEIENNEFLKDPFILTCKHSVVWAD